MFKRITKAFRKVFSLWRRNVMERLIHHKIKTVSNLGQVYRNDR